MISSNPVEEIKAKIDIVDIIKNYIQLLPAGKNFKACCPFHKEKTPSFVVSPDRQTWHCFGSCSKGGDVISFVMEYESVEFYEALKILAEKAGIELKRISPASQQQFGVLYDIHVAAKDYYVSLLRNNQKVKDYLASRGLHSTTIEEFEIGFAPQNPDELTVELLNKGFSILDIERSGLAFRTERKTYIDRFRGRIMFPITNTFGKIVAFTGRIVPEYDTGTMGKYVNSPETLIFNKSRVLYGFSKTKHSIKEKNEAVLVEGQMDCLMAYQDGTTNVVAVSGTALTSFHLSIIKKITDEIVFAFDSDVAGQNAIDRAIDMAHELDFSTRILMLPDGKDPADFVKTHPKELINVVAQAVGSMEFYITRYLGVDPQKAPRSSVRVLLAKVEKVHSPIEKNRWIQQIAEAMHIPTKTMYEELALLQKDTSNPQTIKKDIAGSGPVDDGISPPDRYMRLAQRVVELSSMVPNDAHVCNDYLVYFPEQFQKIFSYIHLKAQVEPHIKEAAEKILMLSSLGGGESDTASIVSELIFLLRELKKEALKHKKEQLVVLIAKAQKEGNHQQAADLLQQFDEIVKLVNN